MKAHLRLSPLVAERWTERPKWSRPACPFMLAEESPFRLVVQRIAVLDDWYRPADATGAAPVAYTKFKVTVVAAVGAIPLAAHEFDVVARFSAKDNTAAIYTTEDLPLLSKLVCDLVLAHVEWPAWLGLEPARNPFGDDNG